MDEFAVRTGIEGEGDPGRRYLWTDAFAVMAFLGIHRRTADGRQLDRALRLVDLVHRVLGRHRDDDVRAGWISGLPEPEGALRPTCGGLRIGKALPERHAGDLPDELLEWERDGQYFHYLTKWMHALDRLAQVTGDTEWCRLAVDLAHAAHRSFVYEQVPGGRKRMCWKMSIDGRRPLVPSMGHHDPLDGLVTFARLRATQRRLAQPHSELDGMVEDMHEMCADVATWATPDALGIGGLLSEAGQLVDLIASGELPFDALLPALLSDAERSVEAFVARGEVDQPVRRRLAFRELGVSIGLQWVDPMRMIVEFDPQPFGGPTVAAELLTHLDALDRHAPLVAQIEECWLSREGQASPTWTGHRDISSAMLAVSLAPEAYLAGSRRSTERRFPGVAQSAPMP